MVYKLVAASILIVGIGAGVYGCGDRGASSDAPVTAAPAPVPPPEPPPTLAAQHETALVEMGAQLKDDGLYVTIPGTTFGGKRKDELAPADTDALDRVAGLAKERPELKVLITGYTDNRGKKAANERESLKRAEVVRDYLVSTKHLDAARAGVEGAGSADPVASNDSDEGRAQNRRVVIRIMTEDGKYQSRAALGVQGQMPVAAESPPQ